MLKDKFKIDNGLMVLFFAKKKLNFSGLFKYHD